jgi:hypothetical protein
VSEPGAVATGSCDPLRALDPVATAPGSDDTRALPAHSRLLDLLKLEIANQIFSPVLIIEVPPLSFINREALGFHRRTQ